MAKKISFELNPSSIDKAIKELSAYQKKVKKAGQSIVKTAVKKGTEQAKEFASYMNIYDTGELVNGIVGKVDGENGAVLSTAAHSAFCEFGTGIMGQRSPHPDPGLVGWRYDVNEHGEMGWWYPGKDGKMHWTKGMPSRPYMYDTAQAIRADLQELGEEAMESK